MLVSDHALSLRLNLERRGKRWLPARVKAPLVIPVQPNEVCSADFMSDAMWSERRLRTFNVIDDFSFWRNTRVIPADRSRVGSWLRTEHSNQAMLCLMARTWVFLRSAIQPPGWVKLRALPSLAWRLCGEH